MTHTVYKIMTQEDWRTLAGTGVFAGSADDIRDGYVHLSTAAQLAGTAARHFADRPGLVLVALEEARLGPQLRWEPSRGGDLFPHLYAPLPLAAVLWTRPLPLGVDGLPQLPLELPA